MRGAAWLVAVCLWVAYAGVSWADFDITGDWYIEIQSGGGSSGVLPVHIVQMGTSLQFSGGVTGTIDPMTGAFTINVPANPPDFCGGMLQGQVGPAGTTLTASGFGYFTPADCASIMCACSDSQSVDMQGSKSPCGDGVVDVGEECDDGNVRDGDCCALGCTLEPAGQACPDDGTICTTDTCNAVGACIHSPVSDGTPCSDGQFCNGQETTCLSGVCQTGSPPCPLSCDETTDTCVTACPPTPRTCRAAEKSILSIKQGADPATHKLVWKWLHGAQTTPAEFADPTGTTDYAFCVYAGSSAALVAQALIGADASKWSAGTNGYKYSDATASSDGITKVLLLAGAEGRAKVRIKGQGAGLPLVPLAAAPDVIVQLVNGDNGLCWNASYSAANFVKTTSERLKAKAP